MYKYALAIFSVLFLAACKYEPSKGLGGPSCTGGELYCTVDKDRVTLSVSDGPGPHPDVLLITYGIMNGRSMMIKGTNPFLISNLPNGNYSVKVAPLCYNGSANSFSSNFTITDGKPVNNNCPVPTFKLNEYGSEAVGWQAIGTFDSFHVAYGSYGFDPDTAHYITTRETSIASTRTDTARQYDLYVRTTCGGVLVGDWSFCYRAR